MNPSDPAAPVVRLRGVTRRFGTTAALDDVSLDVPAGAITGLLGRNGAGKTTLMSIIAGHDRATTGTVETLGRDPFEDAGVMSSVSLVRDNQRYPEDFRLRHVLEIGPVFHAGWSGDLARELADVFRLPEKTSIKKYSRGQLSGIAVIAGLASRAPITIFDEPYLGLDATARRGFYDVLMRDYLETPRTMLISTHLVDEMEPLLEHVVVLERGRVVKSSTADAMRGSATSVNGPVSAVEQVVAGRPVLERRRVGGLLSALVDAPADDELRGAASRAGAQLETATLQEVVAAYGVGDSDAVMADAGRTRTEGARR